MRFRRRPSGLFLPEHEVRGFRGVGARGLASIAVSRKTVAVGAQGGGGGGADAGQSTVAVSRSVMGLNRPNGATAYTSTITLTARDSAGDLVGAGGATVAFDLGAGTSVGTIGAVTDVGDGTYTATFTPTGTGTPRTVTATVNGATVTTSMPTITVAWFEVDFSEWDDTTALLLTTSSPTPTGNPWRSNTIGSGGAITLEIDGGYGTSTKRMRYAYPTGEGIAGQCDNYFISRNLLQGYTPLRTMGQLWTEWVAKWDSNWSTIQGPTWACFGSFTDHKFCAVQVWPDPSPSADFSTGHDQFRIKVGSNDGTQLRQAAPDEVDPSTELQCNEAVGFDVTTLFDAGWHTLRQQMDAANDVPAPYRIWVDGVRKHSLQAPTRTSIAALSAMTGFEYFAFGANRNDWAREAMGLDWGRLLVFDNDPGWT